MAEGAKGASTAGTNAALLGLFVSFSLVLITFYAYHQVMIVQKGTGVIMKFAFWKWLGAILQGNPVFTVALALSAVIGGVSLGRTWLTSGTKVAEGHQFTELDKL